MTALWLCRAMLWDVKEKMKLKTWLLFFLYLYLKVFLNRGLWASLFGMRGPCFIRFFFFNFPGASSDGLPRFKAGSAMMVGLVACIMHRFMWELIINNKLNCCENYYTCNITLCSLNTTNGKRKKIVLWLIELGNLYPPHGIYNKFSDISFYLLFYVIVDVIYFH